MFVLCIQNSVVFLFFSFESNQNITRRRSEDLLLSRGYLTQEADVGCEQIEMAAMEPSSTTPSEGSRSKNRSKEHPLLHLFIF
jgi:hypothetical protein